jgi:choline kinase
MNESLFCASDKLLNSVIISYSDIIFEGKIIQQMLKFSGDMGIAVNLNWQKYYDGRSLHPLNEAENVLIKNEKIIQIKKDISEESSDKKIGEFLGIVKLSKEGAKVLLQKYLDLKENHTGSFHMAKSLNEAYITDMLQEIIDSGYDVSPVIVDGNWCEIDTPQDLEKVERSSIFN